MHRHHMFAKPFLAVVSAVFLCTSCHQATTTSTTQTTDSATKATTTTTIVSPAKTTYTDAFRRFRDALNQNDQKTVKSFFVFPMTDSTNQIWNILNPDFNPADTKTPFTEKDFDKYYSKVFPKDFISTISKIDADALFQKGEATSPAIKIDKITYTMTANMDSATHTLSLNQLATQPGDKPNTDGTELSTIYIFTLTGNGQMVFNRVELAG